MKSCKFCKKELHDDRNTYCNNKCQKEFQYNEYIKSWKAGKLPKANIEFYVSNHIRRYLFEKYDSKCSRCGWDKPNPYINSVILEVEHLDGDASNHDENNLDLICPNCHSLTPTYRALNAGKGNRKRLEYYGRVAQLAEQSVLTRKVEGSTPSAPTSA